MKKIVTKKTHFGETTAYYNVDWNTNVLKQIVIDLAPWMRLVEGENWKLELEV